MKTTLCMLAAILAMGFWRFDPSYLPSPRAANKEAATTGPGTKVAIIDTPRVVEKCSLGIQLRKELGASLQPFKDKAAKIHDELAWLKNATRYNNLPSWVHSGCLHLIQKHQTNLDQMEREIVKMVTAKNEESNVLIGKNIEMGIDAVAKAYGFQLVLGFRKTKHELSSRLVHGLGALDLGSMHPFYIHGSVDITEAVIETIQWNPQVRIPAANGK